ncbi:histone acetylation protein-domain-containing protein [Flagelloscypha sp. PMI_526]|nr:histone acetylation protein-domain-containing protein [Flagelloscypha sp. PMI_526]
MSSAGPSVGALRDAILSSLSHLPGTRTFHVNLLLSSPRKHTDLFPFALPRPKTTIQDLLLLISESSPTRKEHLFVTAIELSIYVLPSTSSGIVYVTKVDSTGQGMFPSPTSTAIKALLKWYMNPQTRPIPVDNLWVQLFARAQSQYLFPNSADWPGKKPLSDVRLCAWWKKVLSDFHSDSEEKVQLQSSWDNTAGWVYGHPYASHSPNPCPPPSSSNGEPVMNLGHFIPSFDDDPKSRFVDEIAYDTNGEGVKSPQPKKKRKVIRMPSEERDADPADEDGFLAVPNNSTEDDGSTAPKRPLGRLSRVGTDEFWERMSFRQECVAGQVTGFFTLIVSSSSRSPALAAPPPIQSQPGQVSSQLIKRVLSSLMTGVEFSTIERAVKATETIEGAIKGLCDGVGPFPGPVVTSLGPAARAERAGTPPPPSNFLLHPPSTPPSKQSGVTVSPNPFAEPEPSFDTYATHIHASMDVENAPLVRHAETIQLEQQQPVTVLTVRRKKKRPVEPEA